MPGTRDRLQKRRERALDRLCKNFAWTFSQRMEYNSLAKKLNVSDTHPHVSEMDAVLSSIDPDEWCPVAEANNKTAEIKQPNHNETILSDDYPIYGDYWYLFDGVPKRSDYHGITVKESKRLTGATEIRSCDFVARMLPI